MENEGNTGVDYASFLADLRAKRDALDKAISAIEQLTGQTASSGSGGAVSEDIRDDSFFQMSIPEAAKKLLAMKKKALTTQEIAEHLKLGGMTHTSENFANTVGSVLNRVYKNEGGIVNISRGKWGLSGWYPNRKKKKKGEGSDDDDGSEKVSEG
jgi:hypothetical protein